MRATWACYLRNPDAVRRGRGFTLLELLVVLALGAMLTGIAVPALLRGLDSARERGAVSDVTAMLAGLPAFAFQRGEPLALSASDLARMAPALPDGWRLEVDGALRYSAAGVAEGGAVTLRAPGREPLRWQVTPQSGVVDAPAR